MKQDFRSTIKRKCGEKLFFQGEERTIEDIHVHDWQGEFYKLSGVKEDVHYSCFESPYLGQKTIVRTAKPAPRL